MNFLKKIFKKKPVVLPENLTNSNNEMPKPPMHQILSYYVTDNQLIEIEKYLSNNIPGFDIQLIKKQIKEEVYLSNDTSEDGRSVICINYPEGFQTLSLPRIAGVDYKDSDAVDKYIKSVSSVTKYYNYFVSDTTLLTVNVAAMYFSIDTIEGKLLDHLNYDRRSLYMRRLIKLYNDTIADYDPAKFISSIPIDKLNNNDF